MRAWFVVCVSVIQESVRGHMCVFLAYVAAGCKALCYAEAETANIPGKVTHPQVAICHTCGWVAVLFTRAAVFASVVLVVGNHAACMRACCVSNTGQLALRVHQYSSDRQYSLRR